MFLPWSKLINQLESTRQKQSRLVFGKMKEKMIRNLIQLLFRDPYLDKEERWQHTQSLHVSNLPIYQVLLEEAYKDSIVKEN